MSWNPVQTFQKMIEKNVLTLKGIHSVFKENKKKFKWCVCTIRSILVKKKTAKFMCVCARMCV